MIKKVYAEITNVCNLNCSFCHGTSRQKKFITLREFERTAQQVSQITKYIYLHLMGEPLLHPQLNEILNICNKYSLKVTITTNGTLLKEKFDILKNSDCLYKLVISVHSFESNNLSDFENYMSECCFTADILSQKGIITSFRLWNNGGENKLNSRIFDFVKSYFNCELTENRKGLTVKDKIYIELGNKFDWPDKNNVNMSDNCFCYGLRDQIGILCDGTVVPCCLDADGTIPLGNIHNENLTDIINNEKSQAIYNGFSQRKAINDLCKKCTYARRFDGDKNGN